MHGVLNSFFLLSLMKCLQMTHFKNVFVIFLQCSFNLPARNARIQSSRSFSLATVKYNVYCGSDRPGS